MLSLEKEVLREMRERIVKGFIDVVVMAELRNGPMSGYDVIGLIHKRFGILVSSGTIYSLLYSMEREGLIRGTFSRRKRIYSLTDKGRKNIEIVLNANDVIQRFVTKVLGT